ncbi:MAG: hypothetical protein RL204_2234 [Bacteroidota bacterium]
MQFGLRYSLMCLIVLLASIAGAQQEMRIKPKWKLGDSRSVKEENVVKVYEKGKFSYEQVTTSYYSMTVIDTVEFYTIEYAMRPGSSRTFLSKTDKDTSTASLEEQLFSELEEEFSKVNCKLKIDKSTGLASVVVNPDEMMLAMKQGLEKTFIRMCAIKGIESGRADSLSSFFMMLLEMRRPEIMQTALNSANVLLDVYSFAFIPGSEMIYEAQFYPINALTELGDELFDGELAIRAEKGTTRTMYITSKSTYDKEDFCAAIRKVKDFEKVKASQVSMVSTDQDVIDTVTTWPISSESEAEVTLGDIRVKVVTTTTFR